MKASLILASALLAFASANAYAVNTQGIWSGSGEYFANGGAKTICESMVLKITHTATQLKVDAAFTCNREQVNAPGGALEIKGTELWQNGKRVGTITENTVTIAVKDSEHSLDTKSTFSEKEMTFQTVSTNASNPGVVITFTGKVHR